MYVPPRLLECLVPSAFNLPLCFPSILAYFKDTRPSSFSVNSEIGDAKGGCFLSLHIEGLTSVRPRAFVFNFLISNYL